MIGETRFCVPSLERATVVVEVFWRPTLLVAAACDFSILQTPKQQQHKIRAPVFLSSRCTFLEHFDRLREAFPVLS